MSIFSSFLKVSSKKQENRQFWFLTCIGLALTITLVWVMAPHKLTNLYGQPLSVLDELSQIWTAPFIAGTMFGSVTIGILYIIRFRRENKETFKAIDFYRGMYSHQSRNVYHNIRGFLTHFRVLVGEDQILQATDFSGKADPYLTFAFNMADWEYEKWTFQNELDYFFTYLDLHNSSSAKKVNFIAQYDNIEASVTRMVPDVFITLLQNSIRHGYRGEQKDRNFTIGTKLIKNYLEIEVRDNGIPEDINGFAKKRERLSGLDILKNKIVQNWYVSGKKLNRKLKSVEFEATKENGAKVIIRIPYETIPARTYSR